LDFTQLAGWLALGRVRAGPHRIELDPTAAPWPSQSQVHILFQVAGASQLEQCEQTSKLQSGMFAVIEADRPYAIVSRQRSERIVLVIGRERLSREIPLALLSRRVCSASCGVARVLFLTVTSVVDEVHDIGGTHAPVLAEQLIDLLHATLRDELARGQDGVDARRDRIRHYVAQHLRDPQLSLDAIAAGLQWSRRHLNRIYSARGESLMEYVYRLRLEGVRQDIVDPARRGQSLTNIALDWGFSSYSHFCERFRRRYKETPAQIRQRALHSTDRRPQEG
jgi:AraC-like DNA-binding protein